MKKLIILSGIICFIIPQFALAQAPTAEPKYSLVLVTWVDIGGQNGLVATAQSIIGTTFGSLDDCKKAAKNSAGVDSFDRDIVKPTDRLRIDFICVQNK